MTHGGFATREKGIGQTLYFKEWRHHEIPIFVDFYIELCSGCGFRHPPCGGGRRFLGSSGGERLGCFGVPESTVEKHRPGEHDGPGHGY